MTYLESVVLAVVQGVTEFLPVSSSGHLALAAAFMDIPEKTLAVDIMLHLGTLAAVLAVFGKDLMGIIAGVLRGRRESIRTALILLAASVPAGIFGILCSRWVEGLSRNPVAVSFLLILTGTVLYLGRFSPKGDGKPGFLSGVIIGLFQALAVLPGVSRSGLTISGGLLQGLDRSEAARFSFLLFIPAVLGAAVLELPDAEWNTPVGVLAAGFAVSAVVGWAALKVLLRFVRTGALHRFSWYCWAVGTAGAVWFILNRGV